MTRYVAATLWSKSSHRASLIRKERKSVVSQTLAARPAFTDWKPLKTSQLVIDVRETLTLASFAAFKGKKDQVKAAIRERYGVELSDTPQHVEGKDIAFIWAGPDQWIAIAERGQNRDIEVELKPLLDGLSSVVDQSDARAVVRISGPRAGMCWRRACRSTCIRALSRRTTSRSRMPATSA